jgi:hypothetical protein
VIARALIEHKAAVITLLKHSHVAAGFDRDDGPTGFAVPFDPAYAERLFLLHLADPMMVCIVATFDAVPRGVLMAAATDHPFGPVRIARETVWFIEPENRGLVAVRMLDAYEAWARERACRFAGMAGMGDDPDVGKLYRRRGYRTAETHFLKAML